MSPAAHLTDFLAVFLSPYVVADAVLFPCARSLELDPCQMLCNICVLSSVVCVFLQRHCGFHISCDPELMFTH